MKGPPLTSRATLTLGLGRIWIKNVQGGLTPNPSLQPTCYGLWPPHAAGALRILKTKPALAPVEFVALYKRNTLNPAVGAVASVAVETSGFRKAGRTAAAG